MNEVGPQEILIDRWAKANLARVEAQEQEMKLRLQVAEEVFGYEPDKLPSNSMRHPLPNGFKAKIQFKVNESVKQEEVPQVMQILREMNIPQETIRELFPIKYSVKKAILNALPKEAKEYVEMILKRSPGTPSLEIESPKGKKNGK